jgi:ribosomal protein S18 acetylase RimI-like enzyme
VTTIAEVAKNLGSDPAIRFMIGAFRDGELVGIAGFLREQKLKTRHKGTVVGFYVKPQARGQGIGRAMMQALLESVARIDDVEQVVLSVRPG